MFDLTSEAFTHMPFIAPGTSPGQIPAEFCCIRIGKRWKLHRFADGEWRRIATGLPEEATECSPCVGFNALTGKWSLSFIAGGIPERPQFYLYLIADLDAPQAEAVIAADAGFVWKEKIIYAGRQTGITIAEGKRRTALTLAEVEYLYRISPNVERPQELIISGQKVDGTVFSWLLDPVRKTLRELSVDGEAAYKGILYRGMCFYARRDGEFEDRHIEKSDRFQLRNLLWQECVTEERSAGDDIAGWEFI